MEYNVMRTHVFRNHKGQEVPKTIGDTIFIKNRRIALQLLKQKIIERPAEPYTPHGGNRILDELPFTFKGMRVAMVVHTSQYYSGGRVHLFQMAWNLCEIGCDVLYVSERIPKWAADYPFNGIKFVESQNASQLPEDIDLLITDGKDKISRVTLDYRHTHKRCRLAVMNFETPNWVAEYDKATASRMQDTKHALNKADILLCNSEESKKYLSVYLNGKHPEIYVVAPAVNDSACDKAVDNPVELEIGKEPYIVWSARSSKYKCHTHAVKAATSYKGKLHLVCIGVPPHMPKDEPDHRFIKFTTPVTDAQKMRIMKDARCVVAPSLFEGYGMVPGEALVNETPVVAYDLEVLRKNYGDLIIYAKHGSCDDFCKKVHAVVNGSLVNGEKLNAIEVSKKYGLLNMKKTLTAFNFILNKPKVTAQLICYCGRSVQEAIESVYPYVDEIMIAHGPTKMWEHIPVDDSLELIKSFNDKDNKIKLEARPLWSCKREMRQWCADYSTGNRMLIFDADEIYEGLEAWLTADLPVSCPKWIHYWHDINHYVVDASGDARWGIPSDDGYKGCVHPHYRWSYWRNGFKFLSPKGTTAQDANGNKFRVVSNDVKETVIHHLGHCLTKERMQQKHDFYLERDGRQPGRIKREEAWTKWNGQLGNCGDGIIKQVTFEIPSLVKTAYAKLLEMK